MTMFIFCMETFPLAEQRDTRTLTTFLNKNIESVSPLQKGRVTSYETKFVGFLLSFFVVVFNSWGGVCVY